MKKSKNFKSKVKNKKQNMTKKNIFLIFFMSLAIFIVSVLIFVMAFIIITAPRFTPEALYAREATILLDRHGNEFARLGAERRELVTYEDLPQVLIDAIIAAEDSRFYQHGGFDLPRFIRASFGQLRGDTSAGGASTLTMQISKNAFTSDEARGIQGIIRKLTDIYMSVFQIERVYTKEEIMEFYVNHPWLASRSFGVEQASQTLFGKSVRDLNLAEAALMAGLFQNPVAFNPYVHPELAARRRANVLNLMVRHGYITEEERAAANAISIESMLYGNLAPIVNENQGFIDTVVEEVILRTGHNPYNVPMIIETTMDPKVQDPINALMRGESFNFVNDTIQAAVAVTNVRDGSIVGIGNGRNRTKEREFNLATMMRRHSGSSAKPFFAYGPYLEFNNGSTYTMFWDEPMTYSCGAPLRNAEGRYNGMMTMRVALMQSRNIPAVQAFQLVDPNNISRFVRSMGIDYGPYLFESAALGGFDGMSPLQMAAAYATFATGGYYIEPHSFTKITYRSDGSVFEVKPRKERVMSEETAWMMNYINVFTGSRGIGGRFNIPGTDIGAKGGTSTYDAAARRRFNIPPEAAADNWMSVYTPDYSMTVWYGYEVLRDGQWVSALAGGRVRTQLTSLLGNQFFLPNSRFTPPSGVVRVEVELETVPPMLPSAHTPASLRTVEYFRRGTEPTEVSPRFDTLPAPTNGSWTSDGSRTTISWNGIPTPRVADPAWLQQNFNTYYRTRFDSFAARYLQRRLNFNSSNMGSIGYQVYLRNPDGSLTNLGWTANTTFTHNGTGNLRFVVRSAYSIFKANMSSGLEIRTAGTPDPPDPPDPPPPGGPGP